MNKFALVLVFSVFALIKGFTIDNFNTDPYHAFDWLDNDQETFKVAIKLVGNEQAPKKENYVCFLYNQSTVCKLDCTPSSTSLDFTVVGDQCQADKDNPTYKYYYAALCLPKTTYDVNTDPNPINNDNTTEQIAKYLKDNPGKELDLGVTIAVSSGSFLKYSMILLSLLIL